MTPQRKNLVVWLVFSFGFLISAGFVVPKLGSFQSIRTDPVIDRSRKPVFDVPPPTPRSSGTILARPFLFQLAGSDKLTGIQREARLLDRYDSIVDDLSGTIVPMVTVDTSLGMAVVEIGGEPFATVLPQDCPEYHQRLDPMKKLELEQEVAFGWRDVIQEDLEVRLVKKSRVYLRLFDGISIMLFFFTGLLHLVLDWFCVKIAKRPLWSAKALLWVAYVSVITNLHPAFDGISNILKRGALRPLTFFILCAIGVAVLHQLTALAAHRYFLALAKYERKGGSVRIAQRRLTIEQGVVFLSRITWVFVGVCIYMYMLGVNLSSFFAGAGLMGVAIGVMARDIFADFFSGFNILAEDQFGVGDWIENDTDSGEVVAFSLRSTKLRGTDGSLATVSNSDFRRVKNHSNEWSQVDFQVSVIYRTDTDLALRLILEEADLLDQEMPGKIAAPPTALGVQSLGPDGVTLRVLIRTMPLVQWEVNRGLNRRVKLRFDKEGIHFASPRMSLQVRPDDHDQQQDSSQAPPTPGTEEHQ